MLKKGHVPSETQRLNRANSSPTTSITTGNSAAAVYADNNATINHILARTLEIYFADNIPQ